MMKRLVGRACMLLLASVGMSACTFNFDVTSQRTALENQVMGSYHELDDDLILASSVRGDRAAVAPASAATSGTHAQAVVARQDQQFNRDDVEELKDQQILGEARDGELVLLPTGVATSAGVPPPQLHLARTLIEQENHDRALIWQRIIESNATLTAKDLPAVRATYAKMLRDSAVAGQWFQSEDGRWQRQAGVSKDLW